MKKNRSEEEIIADILSVVMNEPRKTNIMYGANLSYLLLCKYLDKLLKGGLIKFRASDKVYELTKKGEIYLGEYAEYERIKKVLEINMSSLNAKETILGDMLKSPPFLSNAKNQLNLDKNLKK